MREKQHSSDSCHHWASEGGEGSHLKCTDHFILVYPISRMNDLSWSWWRSRIVFSSCKAARQGKGGAALTWSQWKHSFHHSSPRYLYGIRNSWERRDHIILLWQQAKLNFSLVLRTVFTVYAVINLCSSTPTPHRKVTPNISDKMVMVLIFLLSSLLSVHCEIIKPLEQWLCDYCSMGKKRQEAVVDF